MFLSNRTCDPTGGIVPTDPSKSQTAAEELNALLPTLPQEAQKTIRNYLETAILPLQWLTSHGEKIARANVDAAKIGVQVQLLRQLVGSKLDLKAMLALNDTSMTDAEKVDALTSALYSLLGEHQLVIAAVQQLLEPLGAFEEQTNEAAEGVIAFSRG